MPQLLGMGDSHSHIFRFLHKFRLFLGHSYYFTSLMHPYGSKFLWVMAPCLRIEIGAGFPSVGHRGLLGYEYG